MRGGFGWFLEEIGASDLLHLPRGGRDEDVRRGAARIGERLRRVLEELGPTFIKIGQVASLRQDLLPPEIVAELAKLQDDVPPTPFPEVKRILEAELGVPVGEVFKRFDETPIGSASIGQVHRAVLHDDRVVAVKVQRPGIRDAMETDLDILSDLARLAERHAAWARHYRVTEVVEEFRRTLMNELNYLQEARNAERLQELTRADKNVVVPSILWEHTTQRVLTMEFVEGIKLNDKAGLDQAGVDRKRIAEQCARAVLRQILVYGVFHADPHPGNLAVLPDGRILFMDFGMTGRLSPELKQRLAALIIGLMRRDSDLILRALHRMGVVPPDIDEHRLRRDIDDLREKYYDLPLSQIHLGESVRDIFTVAFRHRIQIPVDLVLVGKTLITLEGLVEELDPTFRILDAAEPFGRHLLRERFDPRTWARAALDAVIDLSDALLDLPRQLRGLVREARRGPVRLTLDVPETDRLMARVTGAGRQIALALTLLSVSIVLTGWMIASALGGDGHRLFTEPVTLVGLILEALLMLLVLWNVWRSGRR